MSTDKKSPLKRNPLRTPGQSLDEELNTVLIDEVIPYITYPILLVVLAIWSWLYWLKVIEPANPLVVTAIAIASSVYSFAKLLKIKRKMSSLKLGRDGERAVGQMLEQFRKLEYKVFHDLITDDFNLDHVVVSPKGVFSIETKTRSKPNRGECKIVYDKRGLSINGGAPVTEAIIQAKAQKKWLERMIKRRTGFSISVTPVVVFPGWYVEDRGGRAFHGVWVLEPKALLSFIPKRGDALTPGQVITIADHVSTLIRDEYDKKP